MVKPLLFTFKLLIIYDVILYSLNEFILE